MSTITRPLPATVHTDLVGLLADFAEAYRARFADRAAGALFAARRGQFEPGRDLIVEVSALNAAIHEAVAIGDADDALGDFLIGVLPLLSKVDAQIEDNDPEEPVRYRAALVEMAGEEAVAEWEANGDLDAPYGGAR